MYFEFNAMAILCGIFSDIGAAFPAADTGMGDMTASSRAITSVNKASLLIP
ncbi:hypothetical protein D3C76_606570 [compost metagenome]